MSLNLKLYSIPLLISIISSVSLLGQKTSEIQYYRSLYSMPVSKQKYIPIDCSVDFYPMPEALEEDYKVDTIFDSQAITAKNIIEGNKSIMVVAREPRPVQDYWHQGKRWRVFLGMGEDNLLSIVDASNQKFEFDADDIKWSFSQNELWISGTYLEVDNERTILIAVLDLTSMQIKRWQFRAPEDKLRIENIYQDYHHIWFKAQESYRVNEKWYRFSKATRTWEAVPQLKGELRFVDSTYLYFRYESPNVDTCLYIIYNKSAIKGNKLPDWDKLYEERSNFRALLEKIEQVTQPDTLVNYLEFAERKFSSLKIKEPELYAKVYKFAASRIREKPKSLGLPLYQKYKSGANFYSQGQFQFYLTLIEVAITYGAFEDAVALLPKLYVLQPKDIHEEITNPNVLANLKQLIADLEKTQADSTSDVQLYKAAQILNQFFAQHRNEVFFFLQQDWTDWTVAMAYWKLLREYPQSALLPEVSQQLVSVINTQQTFMRKHKIYPPAHESFDLLKERALLEDFARIEHPGTRPFFLHHLAAYIEKTYDYGVKEEEFVSVRKTELNKALGFLREISTKYKSYSVAHKEVGQLNSSINEELEGYK